MKGEILEIGFLFHIQGLSFQKVTSPITFIIFFLLKSLY